VDHGPEWLGGPNATWDGVERKKKKKCGMGCKDDLAEIKGGLQKIPFQILNQGFEFK
jgi:hypothetical protein